MLRLAHTQVSTGGILINDIDDGLPNKTAKRGVGDKNKYQRDGNSLGGKDKSVASDVNNLKQKCYIPFWKILSNNPPTYSTTVPGFIDVAESDRVLISQDRGVIYGLVHHLATDGVTPQPLISVTSFVAADVAAPTITSSVLAAGGSYALTIGGTNFTSLAPDVSTVTIGTTTLSAATIAATAGGTFSATSIVIPESLLPTITAGHLNVVAVATTNLALTGEQTIDGVLTSTNRVLLTGQTSPIQNGIWVTAAGGWARAADLTTGNAASGTRVTANAGGTNHGGTSWICTTAGPTDVVGTDPLTFVVGAAATFVSVTADSQTVSHVITATNTAPVLGAGGAVLTTVLTLTGTGFRSILPNLTSVIITGTHPGTITGAAILGAVGGVLTDTSIVIPASLLPAGLVITADSAQVAANSLTSAVRVIV